MAVQFHHQPVGERTDDVVLVRNVRLGSKRVADRDNGYVIRSSHRCGGVGLWHALRRCSSFPGRFVFGTNIAAFNVEASICADADENASQRLVSGVIRNGARLNRGDRLFDFAKSLIDLIGQFVCVGVFGFEVFLFAHQSVEARLLIVR